MSVISLLTLVYSLEQITNGIRNPDIALREINRLYYRRLYTQECNERGVDVFAADWDNLLLLDACRYDLFEREHDLPGELESRQSRGSSTIEFLRANFDDRDLEDVVYVTANPQLSRNSSIDPSLHATIDVWREEGWNEEYRTVLPETITDHALRAAEKYPRKRLVVHYIQPHYPFIGPTGREHFDLESLAFWNEVREGRISADDDVLERAYRENFQIALPHVRRLMEGLDGKTVVTADHGQVFGERFGAIPLQYYGHPLGVYAEPLVRVPWLVDDRGERREIVAEQPAEEAAVVEDNVVSDRLKQLGYAE